MRPHRAASRRNGGRRPRHPERGHGTEGGINHAQGTGLRYDRSGAQPAGAFQAELSASGLHAGRARGHCPQGRADRGGLLGGQRGGEQGAGHGL